MTADVVIFAPSPVLSITVEEHRDGGDVHVHAGGQGVWQARMLISMGRTVELCSVLSGETGRVLGHLLAEEGIPVHSVFRSARGGVELHDRRGGERVAVIEHGGDVLTRHELDQLYGMTLRQGLDARLVILSGPAGDGVIPADFYRRLAADLRHGGARVVVDLAGERLDAALAGGVAIVKVSDEELRRDGRLDAAGDGTTPGVIAAMRRIRDAGAQVVIVTRAERSVLVLEGGEVTEYEGPVMEVVDSAGAGDSFVGAFTATLAAGGTLDEAARLGVAAGALNVTRHGLGTGDPATIARLRDLVTAHPLGEPDPPRAREVTPTELAAETGVIEVVTETEPG